MALGPRRLALLAVLTGLLFLSNLATSRLVRITEVVPHTDEPFYDYVEIHNTDDLNPLNISGWYASTSDSNLMLYTFPNDTILEPDGYFSIRCDYSPNGTKFRLSKTGTKFYISRPLDNGTVVVEHSVNTDNMVNHIAFAWYENADGDNDYPMQLPTQDLPNRYPLVGPFIMTEILLNPIVNESVYVRIKCIRGRTDSYYNGTANMTGYLAGYELRFKAQKDLKGNLPNGTEVKTTPSFAIPLLELREGESIWLVSGSRSRFANVSGVPRPSVYGYINISILDLQSERIALYGGEREGGYVQEKVQWENSDPWPRPVQGVAMERVCETCYSNEPKNWKVKGSRIICDPAKGGTDCPYIDKCTAAWCNASGDCQFSALACRHPNFDICYPKTICSNPTLPQYNYSTCNVETSIFGHGILDIGIWGLYNISGVETPYYKAGCIDRPIDCMISEWSNWKNCDCSKRLQKRTRKIYWNETLGGIPCGLTTEMRDCVPDLVICGYLPSTTPIPSPSIDGNASPTPTPTPAPPLYADGPVNPLKTQKALDPAILIIIIVISVVVFLALIGVALYVFWWRPGIMPALKVAGGGEAPEANYTKLGVAPTSPRTGFERL